MNVDLKKNYIVYLENHAYSELIVTSGQNLEVENGNCRIMGGSYVQATDGIFNDVVKLYHYHYYYRRHDEDFRVGCSRFYKIKPVPGEMYISYHKIREFPTTLHENREAAEIDAAKERLPAISRERDELLSEREAELARPWYRRIWISPSKKRLDFLEKVLEVYENKMNEKE